jgi:hypothetical protein
MTVFFMMIPVWNTFYTTLVPVGNTVITDTTFANEWAILPNNENVIVQYAFPIVAIGLGLYLGLVPYREEATSWNQP